jgi:serine phosphatase RsbU (regulator of sigma subunit)
MTVSSFINDDKTKKLVCSIAGHCPTLYYNAKEKKTEYFQDKGLGLGILRNSNFHKYVQVNNLKFQPRDVILLYTDGVTEACNGSKEEFGYDNLQASLVKYADQSPCDIRDGIINDLYEFCGKQSLDDDYTLLILKFN